MGISIGGINLQIGADLSKLQSAFSQASTSTSEFIRRISSVNLNAAIKGNPFKETENYVKTFEITLNKAFSVFKSFAFTSKDPMESFSQKTKKAVLDVEALSNKLNNLLVLRQKMSFVESSGGVKTPQTPEEAFYKNFGLPHLKNVNLTEGIVKKTDFFEGKNARDILNNVKATLKQYEGLSKGTDTAIQNVLDTIRGKTKVNVAEFRSAMDVLARSLKASIDMNVKELGVALEKTFVLEKKLVNRRDLAEAGSDKRAQQERLEALVAYRKQLLQANTDIRNHNNVKEAEKKQYQALKWLKENNAKMLREEIVLYRQLDAEVKKTNKQDPNGFLSPAWFKARIGWFVQLRAFWAVYRAGQEALRDIADMHRELARAMRTAESQTLSNKEISEKYFKTMEAVRMTQTVTWKQAGEGLYQLGSAGLSAEESMAALESTMALSKGTEADVRELTKLVAGVYKNFGGELERTIPLQEKFLYFNNIIAKTWTKHQVEISELIDGYKYVSATAVSMGLNFQQVSDIMGILNDHMVKAGRAGQSLRNIMARIALTPIEFEKAFGLKDMIKPTEKLDIIAIFDALHEKYKDTEMDSEDLGNAFARMGMRNADALIVLIQHWDEYKKKIEESGKKVKDVFDLQKTMLDSLPGQWERFTAILSAGFANTFKPIADGLKYILKEFNDFYIKSKATEKDLGLITRIESGSQEDFKNFDKERLSILRQALDIRREEHQERIDYLKSELKSLEEEIAEAEKRANDSAQSSITRERWKAEVIFLREKLKKETKEVADETKQLEGFLDNIAKVLNVKITPAIKKATKASHEFVSAWEDMGEFEQKLALKDSMLDSIENRTEALKKNIEFYEKSKARFEEMMKNLNAVNPETGEPRFPKGEARDKLVKEDILPTVEKIETAQANINKLTERTSKESKNLSKLKKEELEADLKRLQAEIALANRREKAPDTSDLLKKEKQLKDDIAGIDYVLSTIEQDNYDAKTAGLIQKKLDNTLLENKLELEEKLLAVGEKQGNEAQRLSIAQYADLIENAKERLEIAKLYNATTEERLALEKEVAKLEVEKSEERLALFDKLNKKGTKESERRGIERDRNKASIDLLKVQTEISRLNDIVYDQRLRERKALDDNLNIMKTYDQDQKDLLEERVNYETKLLDLAQKYGIVGEDSGALNVEGIEILDREIKLREERLKLVNKEIIDRKINQEYAKAEARLEVQKQEIEYAGVDTRKRLAEANVKLAQVEIDRLNALRANENVPQRQVELDNELIKSKQKLTEATRELKAASNPLIGAFERLRKASKDWKEVAEDALVGFAEGMSSGIGQTLADATGGWQEQQNEVIALQSELAQLKVDYDEAITDGDIQKAQQIAEQMAQIRGNIEDLEDPIKNLGESFRVFFKDLIDGIRKAIIQWLAMQAIMGIVNAFSGGSGGSGSSAYLGDMFYGAAATGGVLPSIKSFRKFSSGGMTGSPTMALLGDNASGKELVIPSENIKKDEVSGYTRDKDKKDEGIVIANFITKEDLAKNLAGLEGKRVVLNHILMDIQDRGPTFKAIKSA